MNYLPIAIIALIVFTNKDNDYKSILKNFSKEDICEILNFMGFDNQISSAISDLLPNILNENLDIMQIAKCAMPLIFSYISQNNKQSENANESATRFEFEEFAGDEISEKLKEYFN